jgi:hypothetical protein
MFESENASTLCESVNIYLFPIIFVHLGTGAWGMDIASSSPLFSTTPLFSKFSYKSFLFQNFHAILETALTHMRSEKVRTILTIFCEKATGPQ